MPQSDQHTKRAFRWLAPILKAWLRRIRRYATMWSGHDDPKLRDAAYWYGERSTLSTFVAALAECGADVLGEYDCERKRKGLPKTRLGAQKTRRGRTDIWFRLRGHQVVFEAKQAWPQMSSEVLPRCKTALKLARIQLESEVLVKGAADYLIGGVFCVPAVTDSAEVKSFVTAIQAAARDLSAVGWAWCFPAAARGLRESQGEELFYPGVMLLLCQEGAMRRLK